MIALPRFIGPYEVLDELGRGAHGVVYRCRHPVSGAVVAVKTVQGLRAERLQSLRREIHALSRIRHPGIAAIVEQGLEHGVPWCAMELVPGQDLWEHCRSLWAPPQPAREAAREQESRRRPRVPAGALCEILSLIRRLCAPLAYLHGEGLVHRDLKPRNILLRSGTTPVLVDFGLVAEFDGPMSRAALEVGGTAVGTHAYSAPEQLEGRLVDARADLYACGSMLYALLTGRTAFETLSELLDPEVLPRAPSRYVGGLPEALDELVLGLLAKEPASRIGHADGIAAALSALGARNGGPPAPAPRLFLYRPALAGRGDLLHRLGRRLSERLREGLGALVFLGGESGVGKTRLAVEAAARFQRQGIEVITGECHGSAASGEQQTAGSGDADGSQLAARRSPFTGSAPLQPLIGMLQAVADRCREGGAAETERILGPRGPILSRYEPSLAKLPGQERWPEPDALPPAQARLRLFRYLAQTLAAFAGGQPVLLVLDDLHWAEELTLEFLGFAARGGLFEKMRLVVLGTFRTEEVGPGLQACLGLAAAEVILLDRLDAEAVGVMAADMLGMRKGPEPLGRSLTRHTEGNPFFVAEYLRLAVEDGLLSRDRQGRWQVAGGSASEAWDALPLPGSVRDLVARRLAGLPLAAGRLVRCAAILGRQASVELLQPLVRLPEGELLDATAEAVRRQVLEDTGQGLLRFVHAQIREAAYQGIGLDERVDLHRAAAEAIESLYAGDSEEFLSELGQHWEKAGDWARAWKSYLAAAKRETARYAFAEAERLYRAALALPIESGEETVEARRVLAREVVSMRGRKGEALAELTAALGEARRLGLPLAEARCLHSMGNVSYDMGRSKEARHHREQALALYRKLGAGSREADVLGALAILDAMEGRLPEALGRDEAALELHRGLGNRRGVADTLGHMGVVAWHRSKMDEALALISEALEIDRELGNRRQEAIRLNHLGAIRWSQGRLMESREHYGRALVLQREIGDRLWEGLTLGNLGATAFTEGRLEEARDLYEQALAIHREVGDRRSEGLQMTNLACIHRDQGRPERARQLFVRALEIHREVGNRLDEEDTLVQMAILQRRAGRDLDESESLLASAEALSMELESPLKLSRCLCERGHVALARGLPGLGLLEQAERLLEEAGTSPQSEYGLLAARLRRAVEAFQAGVPLLRGEAVEDVPEGFQRWLEDGGLHDRP